jgi:hypothetical protein
MVMLDPAGGLDMDPPSATARYAVGVIKWAAIVYRL